MHISLHANKLTLAFKLIFSSFNLGVISIGKITWPSYPKVSIPKVENLKGAGQKCQLF